MTHIRTSRTFPSLPQSLATRPSGRLLRHIRCATQTCQRSRPAWALLHVPPRSRFVVRRFGRWLQTYMTLQVVADPRFAVPQPGELQPYSRRLPMPVFAAPRRLERAAAQPAQQPSSALAAGYRARRARVVPFARHVQPKLPPLQLSAGMNPHRAKKPTSPLLTTPHPFLVNRDAMSKEMQEWAGRVCRASNPFQVTHLRPTPAAPNPQPAAHAQRWAGCWEEKADSRGRANRLGGRERVKLAVPRVLRRPHASDNPTGGRPEALVGL